MKGILGRKVGMTQVFTDHGQAIAVTVIETKPNIVTAVLTEEKNGYNALQLGVEDKKKPQHKKPELGHFAKAKTTPKKFVKEFKGMEGFELGQKVDASIFTAGELVDVIGTSKGKGFAGAIKRHNQSIGPKSHGGGGGSQPQRQTGSLGDIAGNKVVKGMTMPGHMGAERTTMQNLEVVTVDTTNNFILVKGSIPGPRKSFVIVRQAVKGLPSKEAMTLVNVKESQIKNELLEEAKKAGVDVNTDMSINDMKAAITAGLDAKKAESAAAKAKADANAVAAEATKVEAAAEKAHEEADKAASAGNKEAAKEAEAKAEALDKQAAAAEAKVEDAKKEVKDATAKAAEAESAADELQVESEKVETKEGE